MSKRLASGRVVVAGLVTRRLMRQTGEDTMNRKLVYWAYCTYDAHEGRWARGFILAANREEATTKARKRVTIERRRVYKRLGMNPQFATIPTDRPVKVEFSAKVVG